ALLFRTFCVDLCDVEVAALTDAAASAATSSATPKAAAVANLRRFTDSSPLDSNFFSPPPQTALQQTSLPSRSSPPFRTSSFSPNTNLSCWQYVWCRYSLSLPRSLRTL